MDWFTSLPDIDELETAEEFLEYFVVSFEAAQVRVSRLHIMHQFHTRLQRMNFSVTLPEADRMTLAMDAMSRICTIVSPAMPQPIVRTISESCSAISIAS